MSNESKKRLLALAAEARQQYQAEIQSGGDPVYPAWIDDVSEVCSHDVHMTNQNNAAQPGLTDQEILDLFHYGQTPYRIIKNGRAIESALLSKLRAPVADERAALTRQDIFDRFQFLEGLVTEHRYTQIAETALAIYESSAPWPDMEQTIRDLRAELGYVAQYGKRVLPDMCPPATARDRWMFEQGRLAERASAPVADTPARNLSADGGFFRREKLDEGIDAEMAKENGS